MTLPTFQEIWARYLFDSESIPDRTSLKDEKIIQKTTI